MKIIFVFLSAIIFLCGMLFAQDTASVLWPLSVTTTTSSVTSGQVSGDAELFKNTEVNQYTGYNASQRVRIVGNAWPLNQTTIIDTVYVQFAARPKNGVALNVSGVKLYLAGNGGSSMRAKVFVSADSTFATKTEIYAGSVSLPNNTAFDSAVAAMNVDIPAGGAFYIRVYPWLHNLTGSNTGKYLLLQNVLIAGKTIGTAIVNLPTVTTASVTNISTTFAFAGGTVSDDGGGLVSARGICWDTASAPTTAKSVSVNGTGSGAFSSMANGLLPGVKYYLRAYATNSKGTAYGAEQSFVTLLTKTVPTVTTSSVTTILATTAVAGGSVSAWGGDTVTQRGVCWNTSAGPTTANFTGVNGTGTGSYTVSMTGLLPNTMYYVRAFAVNGIGTAYGTETSFTTQALAPTVKKIVAKNGSGDYTTVQAAFDAVPANYTGKYFIFVKKGIYKEKLVLGQTKVNVTLIGEERDSTTLTFDDYAGKAGGTSTSYSTAIDADDFTAVNITFQNTVKNDGTFADQQAVALRVNGDRQAYYNCRLLGYQDTYYTWGGRGVQRTYHWNNIIEGSVDFIFGRNIVVFDSCEIKVNRNNGTLTAAATEPLSKFGYVFMNCRITSDATGFDGNVIAGFSLGRPWQSAPRTVFLRMQEPANLLPAGWLAWNVPPALYAEYACFGPGFVPAQRVAWSSQLTDSSAALYTVNNIFAKGSHSPAFSGDWVPVRPTEPFPTSVKKNDDRTVPEVMTLSQNFPNPFNPETVIRFTAAVKGPAVVSVHNLLGQKIAEIFNGIVEPGTEYQTRFRSEGLSSGVYFYSIAAGGRTLTRRMVLQH
ncbi:MAG: pectinesterase family protein [Bacteroidota bacterium]